MSHLTYVHLKNAMLWAMSESGEFIPVRDAARRVEKEVDLMPEDLAEARNIKAENLNLDITWSPVRQQFIFKSTLAILMEDFEDV